MKKIGEYDPFFDFFIFSSKRWALVLAKKQAGPGRSFGPSCRE
jgi:hypothetical protein